jgi:hypothetical protein
MKTYHEFITEAKKCWPGYKKKGTKKLFGKTYNNCVKEGNKELEERYEERPVAKMKKKAMSIVDNPKYEGSSGDVWRHNQIIRHTTKNKGGGKQRKKAQHNIDKYWDKLDKEDDLEESSTGERSRGRATLGRAGNKMDRRERTVAAIAKKAGLKGTGKYSTKDLRTKPKDYTTYDSDDDLDDVGSTEQDHYIRTHSSPRSFATDLMSKSKPAGRNAFGRLKHKVRPSADSVKKVKDLRKSITKVGADKQGPVHIVDIMHRDSSVGKGDRTQQIERGKNFIQALKDTPKHLKKAQIEASKDTPKHLKRKPPRARKNPLVGGTPTAVMSGESKQTGAAKRAKLYSKIFGKRISKKSNVTGLMTGKVE